MNCPGLDLVGECDNNVNAQSLADELFRCVCRRSEVTEELHSYYIGGLLWLLKSTSWTILLRNVKFTFGDPTASISAPEFVMQSHCEFEFKRHQCGAMSFNTHCTRIKRRGR